jgi:hypothetical protein
MGDSQLPPRGDEVVATVLRGDDAEIVALNRWVDSNPEASGPLFEELSRHPHADVRDWVAFHSHRSGYSGAVELLTRMTADRNPIIQEVAIGELIDLDPAAAKRVVVPRLRRRLVRSSDERVRMVAVWWLVRVNDKDSIPLIREIREKQAIGADDARFAELVLVGRGEEVLDRLRRHDHERTLPAIRAAFAMRTDSAVQALKACAENAPDEICRNSCRRILNQLSDAAGAR